MPGDGLTSAVPAGREVSQTMVEHAAESDPMEQRPVRVEIEVLSSGIVTLLRSPGCTEDDAMDMCQAVGGGEVRVRDLTPGATGEFWFTSDEQAKAQRRRAAAT